MKGLAQFRLFDYERFIKDKQLIVTGVSPWTDFTTKAVLGTKVTVTISRDSTEYQTKNGEQITNRFQSFNIKVPKDVNVPLNAIVSAVNPVASVYGDYSNQLSVKADDIQVVQSQAANKP